jgi:hypothetical protein
VGVVINIRGTNGSGKTTLARSLLLPKHHEGQRPDIELVRYPKPSNRDPDRQGVVPGYVNRAREAILVGPYHTACGGLDGVANFARQQSAIATALRLGASYVVAEGVLASTVFGSWAEFAKQLDGMGHTFAFAYLQTPLDECLRRIERRQVAAGNLRAIKTDLVADKIKAIKATRIKAVQAGHLVLDIPLEVEQSAFDDFLQGNFGPYRVS